MVDLSGVRGVVWDLDGTLYRYDPLMRSLAEVAFAETALALGVSLSREACLELSRRGVDDHGTSWHYFVEEYGFKFEDFHTPFLARIDTRKTVNALWDLDGKFCSHCEHILLTHSSEEWTLRVVAQLGLSAQFPREKMIVLSDVDYEHKNFSSVPFERALERLGMEAREVVMVEDSASNLVHAHEMGMKTVLIHHGKVLEPKPVFVDLQVESPVEFLELLQGDDSRSEDRRLGVA